MNATETACLLRRIAGLIRLQTTVLAGVAGDLEELVRRLAPDTAPTPEEVDAMIAEKRREMGIEA